MINISSIKVFRFSIGGYGSTNFNFELQGNVASYCADQFDTRFGVRHNKEISATEVSEFQIKLNELQILQWESRYDSDVLDGTQWELEMVYNDSVKKRSYGSNSFPHATGNSVYPSPVFKKLLKVITELIHEPSFFSDEFLSN